MKNILVTGAAGFIGTNLCHELRKDTSNYVIGVDIKPYNPYIDAEDFDDYYSAYHSIDLRYKSDELNKLMSIADCVYHLAADMGGMGFIKGNDVPIMINNNLIDINVISTAADFNVRRLLYSSSACVYAERYQIDELHATKLAEDMAYPADPQDGYGWQKLTTEKMIEGYRKEQNLDFRAVRFHNCYGPFGAWTGGREKAPAAMCRKVAMVDLGFTDTNTIEVWGTGTQLRSYMYIDDCVEGLQRIMNNVDYPGVCNLGYSGAISVDELLNTVADIAEQSINIKHIDGPVGVASRDSDNTKFFFFYEWEPGITPEEGLKETYSWIRNQVRKSQLVSKEPVPETFVVPEDLED